MGSYKPSVIILECLVHLVVALVVASKFIEPSYGHDRNGVRFSFQELKFLSPSFVARAHTYTQSGAAIPKQQSGVHVLQVWEWNAMGGRASGDVRDTTSRRRR
jgi:hypothetical protein